MEAAMKNVVVNYSPIAGTYPPDDTEGDDT